MLEITYMKTRDLKPYIRNAKQHPEEQIDQIKLSIAEFGMNDPIAIWKDNTVIEGHGRLIACQELGIKEVPVIRLDSLSDEQRKAYTLVHNKLTMNSGFDLDILKEELDSITEFDMGDFGFTDLNLPDFSEELHEKFAEETQEKVENILNLGLAEFPGEGKYDIPILKPVKKLPKIKEWIPFNYVLSDEEPEGKAVHFFIDDYQFERIWNNPDRYIEKLRQYVCVTTPDFSPYGDMPNACQLFNHYRKHWVGAYLQAEGLTVIPTIRASTDPRSFEWYLDGEPHEGIVMISSMWTSDKRTKEIFLKEYNTMFERLNPSKVFVYGKEHEELPGNIEYIKTFANKRWEK